MVGGPYVWIQIAESFKQGMIAEITSISTDHLILT